MVADATRRVGRRMGRGGADWGGCGGGGGGHAFWQQVGDKSKVGAAVRPARDSYCSGCKHFGRRDRVVVTGELIGRARAELIIVGRQCMECREYTMRELYRCRARVRRRQMDER